MAEKEKPLDWISSSYKDLMALPAGVRRRFGYALSLAQMGDQDDAAKVLTERLADLLGDADAEYPDIILALVATLQATVRMARDGFERGAAGSTAARG